ncbi:MAG TPA: hypothetical protein VL977_01485 [Solirubrobacteraceae bacterium]|nr:hypothetical protein [Solirubrobacteraceae bacterium]
MRPIFSPRRRLAATLAAFAALAAFATTAPAALASTQLQTVAASAQLSSLEATLEQTLSGVPGVDSTKVQALIADLNDLASGSPAPELGSDLEAVLGELGDAGGGSSVVSALSGIVGDLLTGSPGSGEVSSAIAQLESLASDPGVPPSVAQALDALAGGLTGADLSALLGQLGSPLNASTIQGILGDLQSLGSLPSGSPIPTGDLSSVAQALETIAAQPGVPASVASVLDELAGELGSGSTISPSTLEGAASTLADTAGDPGLDSTLSELLSALSTELTASPPASSGGSPGSSTPYDVQVPFVATPTANPVTGAQIKKLGYRDGRAVIAIACPSGYSGRCNSKVYVQIKHGRLLHRRVSIAAGKTTTVRITLPARATAASARPRKLVLVAAVVTKTYAASKTLKVRIK